VRYFPAGAVGEAGAVFRHTACFQLNTACRY